MAPGEGERTLIHFAEARLVSLPHASYIELGKPEISGCFQCSFCQKKTSHEHEFSGRVKFDPKAEKLFVSFLTTNKVSERRAQPKLQIIPIDSRGSDNGNKKRKTPDSKGRNSKSSQIFPFLAGNNQEAIRLFKAWMYKLSNRSGGGDGDGSRVMAVRTVVNNELVLLRAEPEPLALAAAQPCVTCSGEDSFSTVEDLCQHFLDAHKLRVQLKRVVSDSPVAGSLYSETNVELDQSCLCPICNSKFRDEDAVTAHVNEAHAIKGEANFQCNLCLQHFKSKTVYKQHVRIHKKERIRKYSCNLCSKNFLKSQHLESHLRTHMGVKSHICNLCEKKYSSSFALKSHLINAHDTAAKPKCDDCQRTFYSQNRLNRHIALEHKGRDSRLSCPHCGQYYLRRDNLETHVASCHSTATASDLECKVCDGHYANKGTLEEHQRACHGILPWSRDDNSETGLLKCKICDLTFLPAEMENHLRFSHGVTPVRPGAVSDFSISEAAEALLRTLTPQPDYLLRCLTPLPMETLDDFITQQ